MLTNPASASVKPAGHGGKWPVKGEGQVAEMRRVVVPLVVCGE